MPGFPVPAQDWIEILLDSVKECAETQLGCAAWQAQPIAGELPADLAGVYIPLISDNLRLQIGVISTVEGCAALTRCLLGRQTDVDNDIVEALEEIGKSVADGVRHRVFNQIGLRVGLPLFVEGYIHITDRVEIDGAEIRMDDIQGFVFVIHREEGSTDPKDGFIHHHLSKPFPN